MIITSKGLAWMGTISRDSCRFFFLNRNSSGVGLAQLVECLCVMHKALGLIPSTTYSRYYEPYILGAGGTVVQDYCQL